MTESPTGPVTRLDELIHPAEIEAMELYPSGAGVLPRFGGMDARCGVILIWRKRERGARQVRLSAAPARGQSRPFG